MPISHHHLPLIQATDRGDLVGVRALCEAGADVEATAWSRGHEWTPLFVAAMRGHVEVVRALCAAAADVNKTADWCHTPLYLAARRGHVEVVRALCEAGADTEKGRLVDGRTPMITAAWTRRSAPHYSTAVGVVRALCEAGADMDRPDTEGYTPMGAAVHVGNEEAVRFLCAAGARIIPGVLRPGGYRYPPTAPWRTAPWRIRSLFVATSHSPTPLHYARWLSVDEARYWLRAEPFWRFRPLAAMEAAADSLSALEAARYRPLSALEAAADSPESEACRLVTAAYVWSPEAHDLFPASCRALVRLLLLAQLRVANQPGFDSRATLVMHVLPYLVSRFPLNDFHDCL